MRYHNITKEDMLNGDGLRTVLWLAGCSHACPGCQNPQTHPFDGGRPVDIGELFAAISGYATDGHRFIPAALARGAACVLCEHDMPEHTPWVRVRDARAALAQLGCNWFGHPAERLCMIGVTGTNGKTTVTCLVKHVLEQTLGAKVGLIGTIENRIGEIGRAHV